MVKPVVRTKTGAKVTLTLELTNLGSWGPECQINQVYKQALDQAAGKLGRLLNGQSDIRIVGRPIVQAITTDVEVKS
ncbi:TPA: hypothetical protein ACQVMA_003386 [Serratia marcescens]|uniref:Uncharacterized protein n=1 Tax=Serratia nevei TaxID=2703794 RepID=A0AAW6WZH1_9GAMM|nr:MULTISPECIES: hypothetical protein [Serratia]MDK4764211.1 hypothetical protein [Serratia nevei]MDK4771681.1 hypothetical protein [Serratia nevei]MDK4794191.1 hypothetical protein [Serratia nevei]MDK4856491.1 hypothetical protein [Serratia nevei]MDK4936306.1 hypothetical protein [Serratia nevei]